MLFIIGPTASGKTGLSYALSKELSIETINADTGQFYRPLSIGTTKPDWENTSCLSHLFDILNEPENLSSFTFHKLVQEKIAAINARNNVPVIVGGSLFYIKSLFFPPYELKERTENRKFVPIKETLSSKELWELLNQIDPIRAQKLHPHDTYRIKRALAIWYSTGKKPSELLPIFNPTFHSFIVEIVISNELLRKNIRLRTVEMIKQQGWIQEAKNVIGTKWELFIRKKGLIGYAEIFDWILRGEKKEEVGALIQEIQTNTINYAKRQKTFLRKFINELKKECYLPRYRCFIGQFDAFDKSCPKRITESFLTFLTENCSSNS